MPLPPSCSPPYGRPHNIMKKTLLTILLLLLPAMASAQSAIDNALNALTGSRGGIGGVIKGTPAQIVGNFINTIVGLLGVVAIVLIVYAGGLWLTAAGG